MAFVLECKLQGYEVRGINRGVSRNTGNEYRSIRCESPEGSTLEISCPAEFFGSADRLVKGDIADFAVRAVSTAKYSYVTLIDEPVVSGNAYGGAY